jgi:hypothetical protein
VVLLAVVQADIEQIILLLVQEVYRFQLKLIQLQLVQLVVIMAVHQLKEKVQTVLNQYSVQLHQPVAVVVELELVVLLDRQALKVIQEVQAAEVLVASQ